MKQNTQEWLELRKNYIGASDAPIIMKVSPWRTPFQLWEEKLGVGKQQQETSSMRYGKENEETARKAYEEYTSNLITPDVIFHPTRSYAMASLDGINMNGDLIVEIKNANQKDHELAKSGKVPEKYFPQLQHQLDCLPGSVLHYWSFYNNEGVLVEVERDEGYISQLISEEGKFWELVEAFESPPLLEKDYITFVDDEEWASIIAEAKELADLESDLKMRKELNREAMLNKCNDRSALGNGAKFTKSKPRGRIDYSGIPELLGVDLDQYRKPSTYRWTLTFEKE